MQKPPPEWLIPHMTEADIAAYTEVDRLKRELHVAVERKSHAYWRAIARAKRKKDGKRKNGNNR